MFPQAADLYRSGEDGKPQRLVSARQLGGTIVSRGIGPDRSVLYIRVIDSIGVHSFHSIPVTGGQPRLVVRLDGTWHRPARVLFSAGARELYFTVTQADSDLWMIALDR